MYCQDNLLSSLNLSLQTNLIGFRAEDNDGKITIAEAASFTGTLNLSRQGLTNVDGLQAFTNVTIIDLLNNNIIDLSPLTDANIQIIQKSTGKTKYQTRIGAFKLEELLIAKNNAVQILDVSNLVNLKKWVIKDNPNLVIVSVKNGGNTIYSHIRFF